MRLYSRVYLGLGHRVHARRGRWTVCGMIADFDVKRTKAAVSCRRCLKTLEKERLAA